MKKQKLEYEEFIKNYYVFNADSFFDNEKRAAAHSYEIQQICGLWCFYNPYELVASFKTRDEACTFANCYMWRDYLASNNW